MIPSLQTKYCKTINVDGCKRKMWHKNDKEFTTNGAENANSQIKTWYMKNYHPMNLLQKLRD